MKMNENQREAYYDFVTTYKCIAEYVNELQKRQTEYTQTKGTPEEDIRLRALNEVTGNKYTKKELQVLREQIAESRVNLINRLTGVMALVKRDVSENLSKANITEI